MKSGMSVRLALYLAALAVPIVALSAPRPSPAPPRPSPGKSPHGMVASASGLASEVGASVLRRGGNAVDASVAVGLALAVTYPAAGNLGGGGFSVIRMADGTVTVVDFREAAPRRAARDMYLDAAGAVVPERSTVGPLAAAVPGTVAGLSLSLEKHGTRKWRELVEPARRLASDGFPVSHALARSLRSAGPLLERFPESRRIFLKDGRYHSSGETVRQPDLAATLRRLQEKGPREFYEGRTAELIALEMSATGGLIDRDDLRKYRPVLRRPLRGEYRGYEILTMPPPSSGGIALIQMLNMLERADLRSMGAQTPQRYHLLIEAMRRAFADRAEFPGDPDFVRVPATGLASKAYARGLFRSIDVNRATPSDRVSHGTPPPESRPETTHYSVVDRHGNAVATTYTLNGGYGSGQTVRGAGFLLNNEMDDFTAKPGVPNLFGLIQGQANAVAPGKRPLSSMTPTLILKDGKLRMVLGSPGGPTIINTVLQVTVNVIDHGMSLREAVGAPRIHHQWLPDVVRYESRGPSPDVLAALRRMGHGLAERPGTIGDVQAITVDPVSGERAGVSDPRSPDGRAVAY